MNLEKTLYTLDQALLQVRLSHQILAGTDHSAASAKAIAEAMDAPIDTMTTCLEELFDKADHQSVFPPDDGHSYFDATPAQIASRVSSLSISANLVMTGSSLCDKRLAESICIELQDTAAWLARKLAEYHDALDQAAHERESKEEA